MRKLFLALVLSVIANSAVAQQQTFQAYINSLQSAGPPSATDQLYILQGGVSRKIAMSGLGIAANILNTVVSSYTVQTSDCGKTIEAGTGISGFFGVTLPGVSGFPSTCVVTVKNGDTGRGKSLVGFPSDLNPILWPLQATTVAIVNGVWATVQNPGRWKLLGNVTFNLDNAAGNDSNDGLATGAGNALLTFAKFDSIVTNQIDTQGNTITALLPSGQTWTNVLVNLAITGGGVVVLNGGTSTLTATASNTAALDISVAPNVGAGVGAFAFSNMTITCSGGANGVFVRSAFAQISSNVTFGSCPTGSHIWVDSPLSKILLTANYSITGGAATHLIAAAGGFVEYNSNAFTVTLTGTPAFSNAFALTFSAGTIFAVNVWSGAATGQRYNANTGGTIDTNGGGATYFPGSTAGAMVQGGHYDSPGTPSIASGFGTSPGSPSGTDMSGTITEGTTATGGTLNFTTANTPTACTVSTSSAAAAAGLTVALSSTQLAITHPSIAGSGTVLFWNCPQRVN